MAERYPLQWPEGWPRTLPQRRKSDSRYKVSETRARDDLLHSIALFGANHRSVVLSTNIKLRQDGLPYANRPRLDDPGVAVYWTDRSTKKDWVLACDAWAHIRDNYRAIGLTVEGLRLIQRAGASQLLDRAYTGFAALPASTKKPWREVFRFETEPNSFDEVRRRYHELVRENHPDHGGSNAAMHDLNDAFAEAKKEMGS
jgi:hypothetical protein